MSNIHAPPRVRDPAREQNLDATGVLGGGESAYNPRSSYFVVMLTHRRVSFKRQFAAVRGRSGR
jgi:hypothetical protein